MDSHARNYALLFDVRRSVRYHARRRRFFELWNTATNALSVVFGSATIYGVLKSGGEALAIGAAVLVTILSSLNLVVDSTRRARSHEDLARQFIELEKAIVQAGDMTEAQYQVFVGRRLDIEANEPPILRVLDSICHNEMLRAEGYDPSDSSYVKIKWWQRLLAQFVDVGEHHIKSQGRPPAT